jgi:hypothetical protein
MGVINEWPYQVLTINVPPKLEIFALQALPYIPKPQIVTPFDAPNIRTKP